jgi:hypothetical protein
MTVSSLTAGAGQLDSSPAGQLTCWTAAESWTDNSWRVAENCIEGQQNNCRKLDMLTYGQLGSNIKGQADR